MLLPNDIGILLKLFFSRDERVEVQLLLSLLRRARLAMGSIARLGNKSKPRDQVQKDALAKGKFQLRE